MNTKTTRELNTIAHEKTLASFEKWSTQSFEAGIALGRSFQRQEDEFHISSRLLTKIEPITREDVFHLFLEEEE